MKFSIKKVFPHTSMALFFLCFFSSEHLLGTEIVSADNTAQVTSTQNTTPSVTTTQTNIPIVVIEQPQISIVSTQCPLIGHPKIEGPRTLTASEKELFTAIELNNATLVNNLCTEISKCANVNVIGCPRLLHQNLPQTYAWNWAPLHHAISYNNTTDVIKKLIELGAFVNITDDMGRTPLHWAAMRNKPLFVNFLLDKGANINAKDKNSNSPLHICTSIKSGSAGNALITRGASISATNNSTQVPFHVKILLAKYGTDSRGISGKDVTYILQQNINQTKYFDLQNKRRRLSNSNISATYGSWQNTLFGDPVPGKYKYLTVWYRLIYGAPTSASLLREITINPSTTSPTAVIGERNDFVIQLP